MAMKYFPLLKFLFWPFEIRNGTSALACLPRIKGEPPHSADKARKPFRRQDSKLRLRCDDSELDAAHARRHHHPRRRRRCHRFDRPERREGVAATKAQDQAVLHLPREAAHM